MYVGPDEHDDAEDIYEDIKALAELVKVVASTGGDFDYFDEEAGDFLRFPDAKNVVTALPAAIVDPDEEEQAWLGRFLRLPYSSRTWVLQEVGLATEAILLWGD